MWVPVKRSYIGNQLIFWVIYVLAFYEKYTFDLLKINHTQPMWVKSSYISNQLILWVIYVLAFYDKYTFDLLKINHTATYVGKKFLH